MATVYGNLVKGYWRAFCTYTVSSTATTYTVKAKTGVNCYKHGYHFDNWKSSLSASGYSASTASSTNTWIGGTTGKNYTTISTKTYTYNKTTASQTKTIKYSTKNRYTEAMAPGTSSGSVTITIPALASYSIKYNANGENVINMPFEQTKYYDKAITLNADPPTRDDYIFKGYATTINGQPTYYPGDSYTTNSALVLYAQWEADSYTIILDANGGQFDPPIEPYIIKASEAAEGFNFDPEVIPTRQNFLFLGWAPMRDMTVSYEPGDFYIPTSSKTWYAQWKRAYVSSTITSVKAIRADADNAFEEDVSGESALISWQVQKGYWISSQGNHTPLVSKYRVYIEGIKGPAGYVGISYTWNTTERSLIVPDTIFPLYTSTQYAVEITIQDYQTQSDADNNQNQLSSSTRTTYISVAQFTMDFNADGTAVCFFGEAPDDKEGIFVRKSGGVVTNIIDMIYPIGSIYMSAVDTSPAVFLGGAWEQIKDTFLLSAGDSYSAGDSGGEANHTLTVDEMPSHRHSAGLYAVADRFGSGSRDAAGTYSGYGNAINTGYTGGGASHNNMPPYLTVYMWKRIA